MNGFYYIVNTCSEFNSTIRGYFATKEDAIKALAECEDWYRPKGTGRIYFREFGLHSVPELVHQVD